MKLQAYLFIVGFFTGCLHDESGRGQRQHEVETCLNHDGAKELVCYGKGLTDDVGKVMQLWVGKLNPSDPAHVVNSENWYKIKTMDEMLGLAPGEYPKQGDGWLKVGDADKDGYADIYFGAGSDGLIMDVEFTGTDISNPDHYKYYPILNLQDALGDNVNSYHAARASMYWNSGRPVQALVLNNSKRSIFPSLNHLPYVKIIRIPSIRQPPSLIRWIKQRKSSLPFITLMAG